MTVLTVAALIAVATMCALSALLAWRVARRVRRIAARCRRSAVGLQTRLLLPGPRRDAATLRRRLAEEVRSTRQTFASPDSRVFQADAASVLADIMTAAFALDAVLASIEQFPDPAQQRDALTTVTPQVVQLIDTSYSARRTMLRTIAADHHRQLNALSDSVAHQAAALARYENASRELTI